MTTLSPELNADWLVRAPDDAPLNANLRSARQSDGLNFAAAVRMQLRKRDAEIAELKRDVAALRDRLDLHERLAEAMRRIDRLEELGADRQAPARAVRAVG